MSAAIQKIEGVASVDVSLSGRFAHVTLKPGNQVDPERIRQAMRDSGFSPKDADVKVAGQLAERDGKPALAVAERDLVYVLVDHAEAKGKLAEAQKAIGKTAVVTGRLAETIKPAQPEASRRLELRDLTVDQK